MAVDHLQLNLPSPLQPLFFEPWSKYNQKIFIKRDDLIHPDIPGNKWRKLQGHLESYQSGSYRRLLTFGGAFSNHISATSAACHYLGIPSIGMIRGELDPANPALSAAIGFGMALYPVPRHQYIEKDTESYRRELLHRFGEDTYIIPEGGAGTEGSLGCRGILEEIHQPFDYIVTASGTGTTLAGLSSALPDHAKAIGVSVLKGEDTLSDYVRSVSGKNNFELMTDYHFGGYARTTPELLDFIRKFQTSTDILLDYVYTGKMIAALDHLLQTDFFPPNSDIIVLHTGGVANAPVR
jgi:1-aminocyclopropane-1-carboxylate deaminase/D-cysteine desulfhydrase-like pyridoxal-dependent ACC family enzyme